MKKKLISKSKVFHESKTGLRTFCLFESITSHCDDHDPTFRKMMEYYSKDVYLDEGILKITIPKLSKSHDVAIKRHLIIKRQLNDMFKYRDAAVYKAFIIELESKDSINRCRQLDLQFVGVYDLDDNMEILFKPLSIVFNDAVLRSCYRHIRLFNNYVD